MLSSELSNTKLEAMGLTRIDCQLFRGNSATVSSSSYVVLNPNRKPGSMVIAGSSAVRAGLGSQVACKLGLENFVKGVFQYYEGSSNSNSLNQVFQEEQLELLPPTENSVNLDILESAFRSANVSVYDFGHQLAAGGRLAASLLGVVVVDEFIAAGKVGDGSVYLFRNDEVMPFFQTSREQTHSQEYIGMNSLVSVQLASVSVQEGDMIFVFPRSLQDADEAILLEVCPLLLGYPGNRADLLAKKVFAGNDTLPYLMVASVGPEAVYLGEPLKEELSRVAF
ncbi:MAG: protein phosphatase 2C domain-containing protein [Bdellovibrionales bacterium]|nr:protein phosphatase 2C domain-containing protein [Bdellovibrionales bacterium]